MKALFLSAAAAAALAAVPVLAQSPAASAEAHKMHMKSMSRADMIGKVQSHFAKMDADKDGFVTRQEIASRMKQRHEKRAERIRERMPDRGAMFDRLDSNKDGSISRSEFMAAEGMMKAHRAGHHARHHAGHHRVMRHMRMGMIHGKMFEMADSDKDGRVSLQEATAMAASHFDKADANRDGTLSMDEMHKAHEAHKAQMGKPGA